MTSCNKDWHYHAYYSKGDSRGGWTHMYHVWINMSVRMGIHWGISVHKTRDSWYLRKLTIVKGKT